MLTDEIECDEIRMRNNRQQFSFAGIDRTKIQRKFVA